jgi:tight adherence protein B
VSDPSQSDVRRVSRWRGPLAAVLRRRRADPAAAVDAIAVVAERLAVLLSAGVPAGGAWGNVGAIGSSDERGATGADDDAVLLAAATAAAAGEPVSPAIVGALGDGPAASPQWAVLAAAWEVASTSGAPLAMSLRDLASALRDEAQLRREVGSALAGPRASARLVLTLPVLAILFGAALGFDTVAVLFGNPLGLACVVVGTLLLWAGHRWSAALARRATPVRYASGLELELLAIAMSGGASVARARVLVRSALDAVDVAPTAGSSIDDVIALAARAGAPVADLLRSEAARLRRVARAEGAARAAALGVRLMLPLGACVLPAFVLLGVMPLLISVVSGTLGAGA